MSNQLITFVIALGLLLAPPVLGQMAPTQPRTPDETRAYDRGAVGSGSDDRIVIPLGQQATGGPAPQLPARGTNTSTVEKQFGEPLSQSPAVGSPPISVWEYAEFAVYFENDRVLHSVLRHRPAAP